MRSFWYVTGLILAFMLVYFVYSAAKLASKFHDHVAYRLVVLCFVRAFAWFVGAVITTANYLLGKGRKKHNA
jgi:hypothetical protein